MVTGTTEYKDRQLPPGNPLRPRRSVLLLDLMKKRYRFEGSEEIIYVNGKDNDPSQWEYRPRSSTSAYDGKALQSYRHKEANRLNDDLWDLSIGKGNLGAGAIFPPELSPIFMSHGIVPTVHSPNFVDKWPLSHEPDDFEVVGKQLLRGQTLLLARTDPLPGMPPLSDEFWIDTQQKSAIHRHVYFSGSSPWFRFDISWKETAHGWWADQWSMTWSNNGAVRRIHRLHVESFEANPEVSDALFTLPAEPGMKVQVSEGPPPGKGLNPFQAANKTYVISPSGSWEEISSKGFTTLDGKELPPVGYGKWIAWTIAVGGSIVVLLFCALRRWRKKAAL